MALESRDVLVTRELAAKLGSKHGVMDDEIVEVLDCHDLAARWNVNEHGVEYLMCRGVTDSGRRLAVVLYPLGAVEGARWRLATAYPDPSSSGAY